MPVTAPDRRQILATAGLLAVAGAAWGQTGGVEASAPAGRFVGERLPGGVARFRGIRYGRADRFRAAAAVARPGETIRATDFGPVCPQRGKYRPQDEDCLFLNVWTPAPRPGAKLPVMFYIHGGAFANGSATDPWQDGTALAARGDVVVVTVNHRLNALGYLYLARLDPRFADSGNLGQLDLILALRWVRDNVAAFGGDPARVMIFGESGGGGKVSTLMGMSAAKGLFHRAATMSGQQVTVSGPQHATARARAFVAKAGVGERDLSPLLTMPVGRLLDALSAEDPIDGDAVYMGPVLDMRWLTRHPFSPDADPVGNAVPMLLGNTHDETRSFFAPDSADIRSLDWTNVGARIAAEIPSDVLPEHIVATYRARQPGWAPAEVFYAATTAGRSWRGQVLAAEARARAGAPTWVFQVDFASRTEPERRAFHSIDIPLAFGTLDAPESPTGTGADARAASRVLQGAFVAFAKAGDPNGPAVPRWPRYDLTRRATLIVDAHSRIENDPRGWQRELFAPFPYIQPGS